MNLNVFRIFMLVSLLMVCDMVFADYNIAVLGKDTINGSPVILIDDVSTNFLDDGFNFLGVIGFFLGLASLYFAKITFEAQKQTEQHTSNAPKSAQIGKLKDLPRHFYRNLICACAMTLKYYDDSNKKIWGKRINYPSESNVLKLKTLPDEIIYDIDEEEKSYAIRHEFKLLLRNYNTEVDIAAEHFSRKNISDDAINQDIDNIIFKQLFLLYRSYDILLTLSNVPYPQIVAESLHMMIKEHFTKLKDNTLLDKGNMFFHYVNNILIDVNDTKDNNKKNSKFIKHIDPKDSLYRSYGLIYKSINDYYMSLKEKNVNEKMEFNGVSFNIKEGKIEVDKQKFINSLLKEGTKKSKTLKDFVERVCNISDFDQLMDFYDIKEEKLKEKDIQMYRTIFNNISVYFKYLKDNSKWDFKNLLLHIVVMDCVLETKKIGMVNFSSLL